jgi:hypothetical protein
MPKPIKDDSAIRSEGAELYVRARGWMVSGTFFARISGLGDRTHV